jgi:hypothetical protein
MDVSWNVTGSTQQSSGLPTAGKSAIPKLSREFSAVVLMRIHGTRNRPWV